MARSCGRDADLTSSVCVLSAFVALPFLTNTQVFFWYPSVVVVLLWILSLVLTIIGLRINCTRIAMAFHFG